VNPTGIFAQQRLKYVATINDEVLSETTEPDFELQYVGTGNVNYTGAVQDIVTYKFDAAPSRARRIARHGDVVVSTARTYLHAIAPIEHPPANLIVSTGFAVVRPKKLRIDFGFCKYALRENKFLWAVESRSTGASYPAINASELADIEISVPPLDIQHRIANYLDRETAHIDTLIVEKEHLLKLLDEKNVALISRAVTRGLDANTPLKSSGIEWFDDIPAHWALKRAKGLFHEVDMRTATGEGILLSLRMGEGLVPRNDASENELEPADLIGYKTVQPGQMVINRMRAASGLIAVSDQPGLVSPDYAVFDIIDPSFCMAYFLELFKIPLLQAVFRSVSKGLGTGEHGFLRLHPEIFLALHFPYPPISEQQAIVEFIRHECAETSVIKNLLEQSITLAKERRAALITAAVTGQIPLEEMAA
jgi:type I restriction enzyme S subunit